MRYFSLCLSLLLAFTLFLGGCAVVSPGEAGVQRFMGKPKERVLTPGVSFPNFNTVTYVNLQTRNYNLTYNTNDVNAAISADMQTVGFSINLNYFITSPEAARNLFLYVNTDPNTWELSILEPAVRQSVMSVFVRYSLRQLVENRDQVRVEVAAAINAVVEERLAERNPVLSGAISVTQVALTNLDYSREFEQMIEATQREEQRIRLARNELERARVENERQLVEAQAERLAAVERARGEAEALEIRTTAQSEAYERLRRSGVDVNKYLFLERWNGTMPTVLGGDTSILMGGITP
jgi:regulator of protease activity HflC (stomatin/prohibitin superfamily)